MDSDRASGNAYRLVIRLTTREVVFNRAPFPCYKQAVARVADAVRRHARDGNVVNVLLQRQTPLRPRRHNGTAHPTAPIDGDADRWTTLEHWGGDVIGRILDQTGESEPVAQEPAREPPLCPPPPSHVSVAAAAIPEPCITAAAPSATPIATAAPAAIFAPPHSNGHTAPRGRPKNGQMGHRWQIVLSVAVAIAAWLVLAYFLAGGRLGELLGAVTASRPAVATELPFDARQTDGVVPPPKSPHWPDDLR